MAAPGAVQNNLVTHQAWLNSSRPDCMFGAFFPEAPPSDAAGSARGASPAQPVHQSYAVRLHSSYARVSSLAPLCPAFSVAPLCPAFPVARFACRLCK